MRRSGVLILFLCFVAIHHKNGATAEDKKTNDIRLPKSVVPEHYNVSILPDLETNEMEGTVRMDFHVLNVTDRIVMHGVNLTVVDESVVVELLDPSAGDKQLKFASVQYDSVKEFIIIQLDSPLNPGRYRVSLDYVGFLSNNLKGLYRSNYFDLTSQSKK